MQKVIFISLLMLASMVSFGQTVATDFDIFDCSGNRHHLFSELDAGKVIVIAWVMPCGSCITDPVTAFAEVNSYSTSHPGRVVFYMADDYANTSCTRLSDWATNYGMAACTKFSDAAVSMADYGTLGMPKIVVLGGSNHKIYFNKNSSAVGIGNAIDQALAGAGTVGLEENATSIDNMITYPNPANQVCRLEYTLDAPMHVNVEVINALGSEVKGLVKNEYQSLGTHEITLDVSQLSNGIYFFKVATANEVRVSNFTVTH